MCGIAGFVGFDDNDLLKAMCATLVHRGPDQDGFFTAPGVGLAMRRLSVIDLNTGRQPIANEDGTINVVFNGEIYNYEQLRDDLQQRGHVFKTASDTETIVHAYEEYGLDFAKHLRGMFGIALWDANRNRLVLARDRIGEKPLYYHLDGDRFYFGSEIKAILQNGARHSPNPRAVCEFLAAGYVPAPRSFYNDIQKLAPGQLLVFEAGRVQTPFYIDDAPPKRRDLPVEQAQEQLATMLDETVQLCLKSDVALGGFLSGGVDSSVICALMRKHERIVKTFSVGYQGQAAGFNELHHAKRVAEALGTTHRELILDAGSTIDLLPRVLWHYDEPHGEPTSILVYLLCEFTRRHVTVALGGTGGDEIFFGYPRHQGIRILHYYRRLPRAVRSMVIERIAARWPESTRGSRFAKRVRKFVEGSDMAPNESYLCWTRLLHPDVYEGLVSQQIADASGDPRGDAFMRDYLTASDPDDLLDCAARLDTKGYLPEYQLTYMDRMSMAHGLEVRSPLCDYKLVDFALSLPPSMRLRGLQSKHLFKRVALDWVPKEIVHRKKVGFDSPIGQWIKTDLREFVGKFLSRDQVRKTGLLQPEGVEALLGDHMSGRRDYSLQIWSLLALETWHRTYIEQGYLSKGDATLENIRGADPATLESAGAQSASRGASEADVSASTDQSSDLGASSAAGSAGSPNGHAIWSRKRVWEATPRPFRAVVGPMIRHLPGRLLFGNKFNARCKFIEQAAQWSTDQITEYQIRQLRAIIALAYDKSDFYRRRFDEAGLHPNELRSLDDLLAYPLIDRHTVTQHLPSMVTRALPASNVESVSTGGTSGQPLNFYIGTERSAIEFAYLLDGWKRAGYTRKIPLAVLRGRVVEPDADGLLHDFDPVLQHHHYSSFHMTPDNMTRYLDHIGRLDPCFLHVYPSSVDTLARFIQESGVDAPRNVRGIIAESEMVLPDQRRLAEEVFRCRYFSCYGHTEKLVAAAECEHSTDYHVWPTYGYFELLDENERPVTEPGKQGEIVGTGFINTVVPFIRYRTGDHATYVGDHCLKCGRRQTLIRDIKGHRIQERLVAASGHSISWTALNMHDDTFQNVLQFQFFQEQPGRAILRIVPAEHFSPDDEQRILRRLAHKLDGQVALTITKVDRIASSPRGKAIYIEQHIPVA